MSASKADLPFVYVARAESSLRVYCRSLNVDLVHVGACRCRHGRWAALRHDDHI